MIRTILILCLLFTNSLSVIAQEISPFLKNFSATLYEKQVYLEWTTRIGFSCEDVVIEHTTDTLNFKSIYTWPGICGNQTREEQYLYILEDLGSGRNYFRLDLGLSGKSQVIFVDVTPHSGAARVVPNPMAKEGVLYWNNSDNSEFTLQILNYQGGIIFRAISTQNSFNLSDIQLQPGVYSYHLGDDNRYFSGKFIVR